MTRYARITGGLTQIFEETLVTEGPTSDFIPLLAAPGDVLLMGLPNGTIGLWSDGGNNTLQILVEQPPALRSVNYHGRYALSEGPFRIALPWITWVFSARRRDPAIPDSPFIMSNWRVYINRHPITGTDQLITPLPLHNVYADGRICFGSAVASPGATIGQHITGLINNFWDSGSNDDVQPVLPYSSYDEWVTASELDPNCWQRWGWDDQVGFNATRQTLMSVISQPSDRVVPIIANDPIPELPMGPTWGRANEWFSGLGERERNILRTLATTA